MTRIRYWAFSLSLIILFCLFDIARAQTEVRGDVFGVWKAVDSPFIVKADITVSVTDTLVIEPGVDVLFDGHYGLRVKGLFKAVGTATDSIEFTHKDADSTWSGINFSEANENSILEYCLIEYADKTAVYLFESSITIQHNTIRNNQDVGSQFQVGMGGGIFIYASAPLISQNRITNNTAERGGGIEYNEGGGRGRCRILNNVIVGNSAGWGGGIRVFGAQWGTELLIRNNVMDNNSADFGGNLYVFSGANPEIVNNIIINSPKGSGILNLGRPDIHHNDVWNNLPSNYEFLTPGTGDISVDPDFVDGTPFDYHLRVNSQCIDAGDPVTPLDPDNTIADMGAYFFGVDLPPIPLIDFVARPSDQKILLQWQVPNLMDYQATRLVRRKDRFPSSPEDGEIIFEGGTLLFQDIDLENGREHFYAAFVKDAIGQFSEASVVSAVPQVRSDPLIRIPIDYVTIQSGLNAASPGDTVVVYPGTYSPSTNGEVFPVTLRDGVVLTSKSGRDSTVVDAEQTNLVFMGASDATIRGLTIAWGWNSSIAPDTTGPDRAPTGGGILCKNDKDMKILENAIVNNRVDGPFWPDGRGGGIVCDDSEVIIKDNIISDNFADREHGGISCSGGSVVIEDNQILRNKGGGIGLSGIDAIVKGNLIARNFVTGTGRNLPGGIDLRNLYWGSFEISNNTIAYNYNSQFPANICGICQGSGDLPIIFKNNIVWGHDDGGAEIEVNRYADWDKSFLVSFSCVEGSHPGPGNIAIDPQFVDIINFDFNLRETSACIDRGDPESPRDPDSSRADIGAFFFEHQGEAQLDVEPRSLIVYIREGSDASEDLQIINNGDWPLQIDIVPERRNNQAGASDPDEFGYSWIDSDNPNGPTYEWIEIDSIGTEIDRHEDVALPFDFNFYGNVYNRTHILYYGILEFSFTFPFTRRNSEIPSIAKPNNLIAGFWDDFPRNFLKGSIYYYADAERGRFIVEYVDMNRDDLTLGRETFQIILNEDGSILFQYKDIAQGSRAAVGIEDRGGNVGIQVAYNEDYLHDSLAVEIFQGVHWLSIQPVSERIEAQTTKWLPIAFNSRKLRPGTYEAGLHIRSNDADDAEVRIPVFLNINASGGDLIPPAAVQDLYFSNTSDSSVTVKWTAPGDDGDLGVAFEYDLRYATTPPSQDTTSWWQQATIVTGLPSPTFAGQQDSVTVTKLSRGHEYYFSLVTADEAGNWSGISNIARSLPLAVDSPAPDPAGIPNRFDLSQNYPNPFNPETTIKYQLPKTAEVRLEIFNLLGQRVATLVDKEQLAGFYSVKWNGKDSSGRNVASGIYLYKFKAEGFVQVRKLTLFH